MKFKKGQVFQNDKGTYIEIAGIDGKYISYKIIKDYETTEDTILEKSLKENYYHKIN